MKRIEVLCLILGSCVLTATSRRSIVKPHLASEPLSYVDVFVGTGGHGHTFPGATTPWGMVQATPWCHSSEVSGWDTQSGYSSDGRNMEFFGMAHTALSGAGSGELGELRLHPRPGLKLLVDKTATEASPGFIATRVLDSTGAGIDIESSATPRGAIHRFTFPPRMPRAMALHLEPAEQNFFGNKLEDVWAHATSDRTVEGCTLKVLMGWGAPVSVLCFVVEFDTPFTLTTTEQASLSKNTTFRMEFQGMPVSSNAALIARVGISRTNIEHARANFAAEIAGKSLDAVKDNAQRLWRQELSNVKVTINSKARTRMFYSALYHTMLAPNLVSDVDGSFRIERLPAGRASAPEKGDPYFWGKEGHGYHLADLDDTMPIRQSKSGVQYGTFSLWDTYRSLHPLYNLLWPGKAQDFAESLLTYAEEWKMLPHSEIFTSTSDMMSGDGGSIVVAAAARLGLVNGERALRALNVTRRHSSVELAYLLKKKQGKESVSVALEQGMADSCVGRLAQDRGWTAEALFFSNRATSIRKYWNNCSRLYELGDQSNLRASWKNRQSELYTEGSPLQYSWAGQFDIDWQVKARGGRKQFACDLNKFFTVAPVQKGAVDMSGNIHGASLGDEPCLHTPYLFSLVGYPALTQRVVDLAVKSLFSDSPAGLPGNDDMGEMSSWLAFSILGLYPADPCSGQFALGRPFIDRAELAVKEGILQVLVHAQSEENKYVQKATWKGQPLEQPLLSHADLAKGGILELWMSSKPPVADPVC